MGQRLTQIATRTGDDGTTGLGDNTRVHKHSVRVQAMGDVDELNSHLGLLLCENLPQPVRELLVDIQHQLFNLGGELSIPGFELLQAAADAHSPTAGAVVALLATTGARASPIAWRWTTRRMSKPLA